MSQLYKACCVLLLAGSTWQATAQQISPFALNATGGFYKDPSSYYQFEWSIGELTLIDAWAPPDSSIFLTQGLLQPCTEFSHKSYLSLLFAPGEYRLFPNPTPGKFELNFFVRETGKMELRLVDGFGKVLETREHKYDGCCRIEYFDLSRYPAGTYYVQARLSPDRLRGDNKQVIRKSSFRVIKIDNR